MTARSLLAIRPASPADAEAIVELVEAGYRGERSRRGWTTEADLLDGRRTDVEDVSENITSTGSRILLGEDGGQLVACCHLRLEPDGAAYFGLFAVWPERQGHGIGRLMVGAAERVAKGELHAPLMRMSVIRQRAELIAWYERLGYARTGQVRPFPYGQQRFGLPRREDLEFVVLARVL